MQSNTLKIVLSVIITAILVGGGVYFWQNPQSIASELETYSSEKYSFDYPSGYSITVPTESFPVLTVEKAQNKKVEIFQMKDFGDRPWGFEGDETQEEIDGYVPRETFTIESNDNQYDVWLYYSENDTLTKKELTGIFKSIGIQLPQ